MYFVGYIYFALDASIKNFLVIIMLINVVAPAISLGTMISRKMISDLEISQRSERLVPFLLMVFYYGMTYGLLRFKVGVIAIPTDIYSLFTGIIISVLAAIVINTKFKISIHAIGAGGLLGGISALAHIYQFHAVYDEVFWLITSALVLGLVGTARIYAGKHTLWEVVSGSVIGFGINYMTVITGFYF